MELKLVTKILNLINILDLRHIDKKNPPPV